MPHVFAEDEVWVEIPGTGGNYFVSSKGRFKSIARTIVTKRGAKLFFEGKILKPSLKSGRYLIIRFGFSCQSRYAHRIVAEAFLPNPKNLPEVNHKDFNRENNNISNLEWCTRQQNSDHLHLNKKIKRHPMIGEKNYNSKLTEKDVLKIRAVGDKKTPHELAEKYRVSYSCIKSILSGRIWTHLK